MRRYRQTTNITPIKKPSAPTDTQLNHAKSLSMSNLEFKAPYMQLNVKSMLLHGVTGTEVVRNWLASIGCEEYVKNFIDHGYDMPLLSRMTPQDLAAIGCKSPGLRRKLLSEIKKLNLKDDIPKTRPHSFEHWLELLKLTDYQDRLCEEGYNTIDKVCELTWEDLEEIGIYKLGHQKKLLIGIENVRKFDKLQEDRRQDFSIYDVHPNHRVSLSETTFTMKRNPPPLPPVRSNSLRVDSNSQMNNNNLYQERRESIYGNSYGVISNAKMATYLPTNKNSNGRITNTTAATHQTSNQVLPDQMIYRSIVPVREAPLPPLPANPPRIPERIEEETTAPHNYNTMRSSMVPNSSFVGVSQLASADEFPPPPPSQ